MTYLFSAHTHYVRVRWQICAVKGCWRHLLGPPAAHQNRGANESFQRHQSRVFSQRFQQNL